LTTRQGETGFVGEETLKRHLPTDRNSRGYFICGPAVMLSVLFALLQSQ
jgi:NAD(P)H-flavin reductase